jgi:hypothetical protein
MPRRSFDLASSPVGQVLRQCAASCEHALKEWASGFDLSDGHQLFHELLPAIAAIRTTVDLLGEEGPRRDVALHLAHAACERAAAECRRYGLDAPLLRCAAACDRAVHELDLLLTSLAHQ